MAPLVAPSWPSKATIWRFISIALQQSPITIADLDQHAATLVEAAMVVWGHVKHALGTHHIGALLQRPTQRGTELAGAGVGSLGGLRHGLRQQQAGVIHIRAEGRRLAAIGRLVRRDIGS